MINKEERTMKKIVALLLALVMVLGVSAAFADAYTIPKTLKNVEGLPENPEVQKLTAGKQIVKVIFVPGRLLNIVVR